MSILYVYCDNNYYVNLHPIPPVPAPECSGVILGLHTGRPGAPGVSPEAHGPRESWDNNPAGSDYDSLARAMASEEHFSDLHVGVSALCRSLVYMGRDVTKYANPANSRGVASGTYSSPA